LIVFSSVETLKPYLGKKAKALIHKTIGYSKAGEEVARFTFT